MSKEGKSEPPRHPNRDFRPAKSPVSSLGLPPELLPDLQFSRLIPQYSSPSVEGNHPSSLHSRMDTVQSHPTGRKQPPPKRAPISQSPEELEKGKWKLALEEGDVEGVKNLIEKGCDVNELPPDEYNRLPLMIAAIRSPAITELILKAGAAVDGSIGFTGTPLQAAIACGSDETRKETVQLLLRNGANVNATAGGRGTALEAASVRNDESLIRLLLEHGADVNQYDGGSYGTALTTAAKSADFSIAKLLLDHGADPNAENAKGSGNGLLLAICRLDENLVRLFLERGADCNAKVSYVRSFVIRKYIFNNLWVY
jgi:ankyrin repeat protein